MGRDRGGDPAAGQREADLRIAGQWQRGHPYDGARRVRALPRGRGRGYDERLVTAWRRDAGRSAGRSGQLPLTSGGKDSVTMTTRIPVLSSRRKWPGRLGSSARGTSHERCLTGSGRGYRTALPRSPWVTRPLGPGRAGRGWRSAPRPPRPGRRRACAAAPRPGRRTSSAYWAATSRVVSSQSHRHSTAKPVAKEGSVAASARAVRPRSCEEAVSR